MPTPQRVTRIREVMGRRQSGFIVVLEDIYDPHNAEAVIRSAEAFGVQDIYFIFNKETPFNPRAIGKKSSSSGNKWVTFKTFRTVKACVRDLRKKKYILIGTTLQSTSKSLFKESFKERNIALWFGNESEGLSPGAIAALNRSIQIPMRGMVQSLNISVSAGICMFEITRQRMKSHTSHLISQKRANKLTKEYLRYE